MHAQASLQALLESRRIPQGVGKADWQASASTGIATLGTVTAEAVRRGLLEFSGC